VLRSPIPHGRIVKVDTSEAEKLPGVLAVVTSADFPDPGHRIAVLGEGAIDVNHLSSNCMARGKVYYKGQPVAAVAADSVHIAEEALGKIKVEYEQLPHVTNVLEAMKPGAPLLHPDMHTEELGQKSARPSNVAKHFRFTKGNVEKGFKECTLVIEREFDTATVHQGYIEPHNSTGLWNADGSITIWTSTQGAFTARAQVAELLQVSLAKIRVVPLEIGGGFGGKIRVYLEPVAAVLSKKCGRPVKVTMSRADCFEATGPTPGSHIKVKIGVNAEGRILAGEASLVYEAGAFPGSAVGMGAMCIFACYDIANQQVDGYDVCLNKPATSAYRAPGATNAAFAAETVIDEICEKLQMDPLDFRIKNGAKEGTRRADGPSYPRIGMIETVEAAQRSQHYRTRVEGPNRGRGVASGFWFNIGLKSSCTASVNADGSVSLVEGSTDIGGSRASIAMQLAEALGIRAEDVRPAVGDTDSVGYTDVTGGSRVTFATGWAAYEVAQDIKRQMLDGAAKIWNVSASDVEYVDSEIRCRSNANKTYTFKELAAELQHKGHNIVGRATVDPTGVGGGFATHIVDVEVDPDTGKVTILRYTAVQDVGRAVHPSYVEGQMQGGAVQGIGWALNEEYWYNDKGEMANASFLDYRMPTSLDLPMIETVIVEVPNPGHPYGVRGVGEVPIVPPVAALANAIYAAVGVRLRTSPMSPPKVCAEILKKPAPASDPSTPES
jgi:CO/xanthine dehydrogenase Mo-binding subunit